MNKSSRYFFELFFELTLQDFLGHIWETHVPLNKIARIQKKKNIKIIVFKISSRVLQTS